MCDKLITIDGLPDSNPALVMLRASMPAIFSRPALVVCLLICPISAFAQHHGGHGMGGSIPGATGRPTGLDEKDSLKDFHEALAVQATSQQIAEFQDIIRNTNAAKEKLSAFAAGTGKREGVTAIDQALETMRTGSRKFQGGFSEAQKSGLKEITKRIEKADADVELEGKRFDQTVEGETGKTELVSRADTLDKALTNFLNEQLALGREMGITLASGDDLTFNLHRVNNSVVLAGRTLAVPISGMLSQSEAQGNLRTLKVYVTADMSDLQQNITQVMSAELNKAKKCGERLAVQEATIMPAPPASSLVLRLHFERWSCSQMSGQSTPAELAEGDGAVEIKLTPVVEKPNIFKLVPEFKRIEASGMMEDALRSGDLGADLLIEAASAVRAAAQASADFKITLPSAVAGGAMLERAAFQDIGAGPFQLLFEGQVQISNEQAGLLANQLNQALSEQGKATR